MAELMSLSAYGRLRGVSAVAVKRAIDSGRLRASVSRDAKGNPKIDPELADSEWAANTDTNRGWHAQERSKQNAEAELKVSGTLNQSRAVKEAYLARLAKLDFEERSGQLVRADDVKDQAFKTARIVRDGMMNIPDRIAAELAACSDQFEVHRRLTEEIRKALDSAFTNAN